MCFIKNCDYEDTVKLYLLRKKQYDAKSSKTMLYNYRLEVRSGLPCTTVDKAYKCDLLQRAEMEWTPLYLTAK